MGIENIQPGKAIMWAYIGISVGILQVDFISHWLHSRKKAIFYMMLFTIIGVLLMLYGGTKSENMYYFYCAWLGLGTGYWAMFVTVGRSNLEQTLEVQQQLLFLIWFVD